MKYLSCLVGLWTLQAAALPFATLTDCETNALGNVLKCKSNNKNLDGQALAIATEGELPVELKNKIKVTKREAVPRECNGAIVIDTGDCLHIGDGWDAYYTQVLINEALKATGNQGFTPVSPNDPEFHDLEE